MGAVVQFNQEKFGVRYPEFKDVDVSLLQEYFGEATIYCRNDGTGLIQDPDLQLRLLNMLTAHIAQLNVPVTGNSLGGPQLVGPIQSASEGSVSVSANAALIPGSEAWFKQTKYGYAFWQATAAFRTMQYRARMGRPTNPFFGGNRGWIV